ncbi:hypothetical protein CYLTODRAFT_456276 [Cylindrobasidium torrendii FP15055 ss-10]|uniref:Uncharacterized protein n=1 Tax=Cylindrobasidium torrendii FP15055 ss-10 TaxID=1314674 RepID=A0A0D7B4N1_9AGAR|nr:hypothetical protein CYLTODRAFT_456276 [Cylindrobasidium torrendii FP15055 ss-10]
MRIPLVPLSFLVVPALALPSWLWRTSDYEQSALDDDNVFPQIISPMHGERLEAGSQVELVWDATSKTEGLGYLMLDKEDETESYVLASTVDIDLGRALVKLPFPSEGGRYNMILVGNYGTSSVDVIFANSASQVSQYGEM